MTKKNIILAIILLSFCILFVACGSEKIEKEKIEFLGAEYEECYSGWRPYGENEIKNNYIIYKNDPENIFISSAETEFSDSVVYHKVSDKYPSLNANASNVEKIVLIINDKEQEVDKKYFKSFADILLLKNKDTLKADLSKDFVFLNIYYKDYPAYEYKWMIGKSEGGELGFMLCSTEENDKNIGNGKMIAVSGVLEEYLNSLID